MMYPEPYKALARISNTLTVLLETMDPKSIEYDVVELLAEYSHHRSISAVNNSVTDNGIGMNRELAV